MAALRWSGRAGCGWRWRSPERLGQPEQRAGAGAGQGFPSGFSTRISWGTAPSLCLPLWRAHRVGPAPAAPPLPPHILSSLPWAVEAAGSAASVYRPAAADFSPR